MQDFKTLHFKLFNFFYLILQAVSLVFGKAVLSKVSLALFNASSKKNYPFEAS